MEPHLLVDRDSGSKRTHSGGFCEQPLREQSREHDKHSWLQPEYTANKAGTYRRQSCDDGTLYRLLPAVGVCELALMVLSASLVGLA